MTTLTITEAKKNLGKWLAAAVSGQDVGIVAGATVVALRPVEVESTDYAWREYGVTEAELNRFIRADDKRVAATQRAGKFITLRGNLKETLEKISAHRSRRAKTASRSPRKRARRSRP